MDIFLNLIGINTLYIPGLTYLIPILKTSEEQKAKLKKCLKRNTAQR